MLIFSLRIFFLINKILKKNLHSKQEYSLIDFDKFPVYPATNLRTDSNLEVAYMGRKRKNEQND